MSSTVTARRLENPVASKDSTKIIQRDLTFHWIKFYFFFNIKKIEPDATFK